MTTEEMHTVEIDLSSEDFEKHVEFLTKIAVQKVENGKFKLSYPKKFENKRMFIKHFEYLCWFWFMTSTMEKFMKEHVNDTIPDYAV
jgi:hypothetical protein